MNEKERSGRGREHRILNAQRREGRPRTDFPRTSGAENWPESALESRRSSTSGQRSPLGLRFAP